MRNWASLWPRARLAARRSSTSADRAVLARHSSSVRSAHALFQLVVGDPQRLLGALAIGDVLGGPEGLHDAAGVVADQGRLAEAEPSPGAVGVADAALEIADAAVLQQGEPPRMSSIPGSDGVVGLDQLGDQLAMAPLVEILLGVAEDRGDPAVDPDLAIGAEVQQVDDRGVGLGQALDEAVALAHLLLGPAALGDLDDQRRVGPPELGGPLLDQPVNRGPGGLGLRLPRRQVVQLRQRLPDAADQHEVLEEDPGGVLQSIARGWPW